MPFEVGDIVTWVGGAPEGWSAHAIVCEVTPGTCDCGICEPFTYVVNVFTGRTVRTERVNQSSIAHAVPRLGDYVFCDIHLASSRSHEMRQTCRSARFAPSRLFERDMATAAMLREQRERRAQDREQRRRQSQDRAYELASRHIGHTVAVVSGRYAGDMIRIESVDRWDARVMGTLRNAGYMEYVYVHDLGDIVSHYCPPMLPSGLQNGGDDRRVTTEEDECPCASCQGHSCTDPCYDYGCDYADIDHEEDEVRVRSYSYSPKPIFYGDGPLYLGTELEVSTGRRESSVAHAVMDAWGDHVYLKEDGSIEDGGFEIVTHPMTYDYIVDKLPVDALRDFYAMGARAHNSCGMHVHVSRSGFAKGSDAYKWLKFLYRNSETIKTLARRDSDRWATWGNRTHRDYAKYFAKGAKGHDRYVAINCRNGSTYEVRVFASTLNPQKFLGSLALVDASANYVKEIDSRKIMKEGAWGFDQFKTWVTRQDKYEPLIREMTRLGV